MPIKAASPQARLLEEFQMPLLTWLVRIIPPAALVFFSAVGAGWKWEGFPH